jgi:6-phosphogluconolactonase (cycloisomerase 2 family)
MSATVTLFKRDPDSGRLEMLDVARDGDQGVEGLKWSIDADFCPQAPYIYAIAPRSAAVVAFRHSDRGKLQFIEANYGTDKCFDGARGMAFSLDGEFFYVASSKAETLTALKRNPATGHTTIHQMLMAEKDGIPSLKGVFQVDLSSDGKFLYTSSGRFQGNDGIGIYRVNADATVTLVKELLDGEEGLTGFQGGNQIVISPTGLNAWAVASRSNTILTFARDPKSGLLTQLQTLRHDAYGAGALLKGAANLALSPDARHVYVGAELNVAVSVFKLGTGSDADQY